MAGRKEDQLFTALTRVLGSPQALVGGARRGGKNRYRGGPRAFFNAAFGYDPSERRDEIIGSVQQALFMMNSRLVNAMISARPGTELGRMLREIDSDRELVNALYLRALARQPTPTELRTCLSYVNKTGNRNEAFEDLLWALLNSAEFIHRK